MPRKKLTEKQEELLSLTTRVDVDLTQNQRILLGYIIQMYRERSNSVEENGYVHASVSTLKKECGMGQDSIKSAITKLENEGLITCEVGRVKLQNTRFSLTEKTKKYIYIPMDGKMRTYSVPMAEKVYIDQSEKIEALELKISELSKTVENLTEEVQKLNRYIGIGVERSKYNTINYHTGIEKESILTDTKEKDEVSGREDAGEGYVQPPVKQYVFDPRYFSNGKSEVDTVSVAGSMIDDNSLNTSPQSESCADASMQESSSSFNEEESHPDSETSTVQQNDTVELTDRSISLHLNKGENPPQVAPHPPLKDFIAVLTEDINRRIMDWAVSLTDPSYTVTESDAQYIVTDALGDHDDKDYYLPQFSLISFTDEVMDKMRNILRQDKIHKIIVRNSISPAPKPYGEINEGTGILSESGTEPHRRFLRAFLPLGGIVGHPE